MSRTSSTSTAKSASTVLAPLRDPDLAPPTSRIEDRPLKPEAFRPESGRPDEADGSPLTKFGWRFREVFASTHGVVEDEVDLGLVRQVEAINADTDKNLASLSVVQSKRTEHGTLKYVRIVANTPMLKPWLKNGRALRRMGSELRGGSHVVTSATDHPRLALPTMPVDGPEAVLEIVAAQRRLLGLENYTATSSKKERRDRVDSIVQFGVLEPPDVVLTQLRSESGSAWVAQAAEGAQRLFSAHIGMDQLASRSVGMLASEHWLRGEPVLRDLSPMDLVRLSTELAFPSSAAAGYFPGRDVKAWLTNPQACTPAAVAFQLLRTLEVNLIIAVEPDPQVTKGEKHPVSSTIDEMIRSYHVPGKAKDQWALADVQGLIAMGAIDELVENDQVTGQDRAAWIGEILPSWHGDDDSPTRLHSAARLIATLTAQRAANPADGLGEDSLRVVNRHLESNGLRVHADDRAKVAAAQAIIALGSSNSGKENTLAAAIFGAFHAPWFWRTDDHPGGRWASLIDLPIERLLALALDESTQSTDAESCGPAQRALAALGGLALMSNPGLLDDDFALTRTARGGGGKTTNVKASDPNVLLAAMVRDERGLHQLHDAVVALTANAEPTIPIDRVDSHILDEFYLREMWLGETSTKKDDNPDVEFARRIQVLVDAIATNSNDADQLRDAHPGDLIGLERSDDDDESLWDEASYERLGVSEELADRVLPNLHSLVEFFTTGKALARAAARARR